jgi:RimJ/RimL family protein N-acetyltransferase
MAGVDSVEIIYAREELIESYHACLDAVARERVYLDMIEAPPLEKVRRFQSKLIAAGGPVYYAVEDDQRVVGWCDVFAEDNPRHAHRGGLGMGLLRDYRGIGLGSRLLDATLRKTKQTRIEKVELWVYTTNTAAIALYRKFGFETEGRRRDYRRLDGKRFDCILMSRYV